VNGPVHIFGLTKVGTFSEGWQEGKISEFHVCYTFIFVLVYLYRWVGHFCRIWNTRFYDCFHVIVCWKHFGDT